MTGFTPGPWGFRFLADDLDFDFEVTRPEDELPVAGIYQWSLGVSEANARLIAAAPELYEALEVIASCGAVDVSNTAIIVGNGANVVLQQAWAALRKARGEA